jgi:hypothetical protein
VRGLDPIAEIRMTLPSDASTSRLKPGMLPDEKAPSPQAVVVGGGLPSTDHELRTANRVAPIESRSTKIKLISLLFAKWLPYCLRGVRRLDRNVRRPAQIPTSAEGIAIQPVATRPLSLQYSITIARGAAS